MKKYRYWLLAPVCVLIAVVVVLPIVGNSQNHRLSPVGYRQMRDAIVRETLLAHARDHGGKYPRAAPEMRPYSELGINRQADWLYFGDCPLIRSAGDKSTMRIVVAAPFMTEDRRRLVFFADAENALIEEDEFAARLSRQSNDHQ